MTTFDPGKKELVIIGLRGGNKGVAVARFMGVEATGDNIVVAAVVVRPRHDEPAVAGSRDRRVEGGAARIVDLEFIGEERASGRYRVEDPAPEVGLIATDDHVAVIAEHGDRGRDQLR